MLGHIANQIHKTVMNASRVLLIPHQNPDGDALGSSTAFAEWLSQMGKDYTLFCKTTQSPRFSYLAHSDEFHESEVVWRGAPFDVIVVFDSGDLAYAGVDKYIAGIDTPYTLINIDHHKTNTMYGDLNLVLETASSTCEMLYRFFTHTGERINKDMATSLLTGIITDTDNFTNAATTPTALAAAGELLKAGGKFNKVKTQVYKQNSIHAFGLWATVLSRLERHDELDMVYTFLKQDDFSKHGVNETAAEGMSNFLSAIEEGKAHLVLKENTDGSIKGSFRTTRDDVDVSAIAKHLGGGGHQKAAGFTVEGPIEQALEVVFAAAKAVQGPELALVKV